MSEVRILQGDALTMLRELPSESVDCVVTSPPYFGLRNYGIEGQMGSEPTLAEYVAGMGAVFSEVRRVLKSSGTLWLNLGDSYNAAGRTCHGTRVGNKQATNRASANDADMCRPSCSSFKEKDLLGVPWRVAFALQDEGWYLRQDIIWSKPNPMPESVRDRCTKSHEYLFMLTKSARYCYDADAIKEPSTWNPNDAKTPDGWDTSPGSHGTIHRLGREKGAKPDKQSGHGRRHDGFNERWDAKEERGRPGGRKPDQFDGLVSGAGRSGIGEGLEGRNKRSVWTVAAQPYKEAHFATFPEEIPKTCILAGCPEGGVVLDPFLGSGTTLAVARRLGRSGIGIELNPEYIKLAEKRIYAETPAFQLEDAS